MVTGVDHAPAANLKWHVESVLGAADDVLGEPLMPVVFPVQVLSFSYSCSVGAPEYWLHCILPWSNSGQQVSPTYSTV